MAGCNRCRRYVSSVWRVYVFNVLLMGLAAWSEVIKCYSRLSDSCRINHIRFLTTFPRSSRPWRGHSFPISHSLDDCGISSRRRPYLHMAILPWKLGYYAPKPLSRPSGQLITHRGIPVPHRQLNHPGKKYYTKINETFSLLKGRLLISVTLLGSVITHKIHRVYSGLK